MLKNRDSWAFAFPPLLFLILPLYYMSAGFPQISYLVAFFLMVLFGAFYVAAWLQIPYRPRRLSSLNIAILAGLIATYLGGWWIAGINAPVAFQASYLCSVAIFLLPARLDYLSADNAASSYLSLYNQLVGGADNYLYFFSLLCWSQLR